MDAVNDGFALWGFSEHMIHAYFRTVITKSQDCVTGANVKIMSHYKIYDRKNGSHPTDIFKIKLLKRHVY